HRTGLARSRGLRVGAQSGIQTDAASRAARSQSDGPAPDRPAGVVSPGAARMGRRGRAVRAPAAGLPLARRAGADHGAVSERARAYRAGAGGASAAGSD